MKMEYIAPEAQVTMLCPAAPIALIEDSEFQAGVGESVIVSNGDIDIDIL